MAYTAKYIRDIGLFVWQSINGRHMNNSEEAVPFDTSIDRVPPPPLVALTQLAATSMLPMRLVRSMDAAATPSSNGTAAPLRLFCNTARQLIRT